MPCRVELSEAELEAERQARSNREIAKALKPVQDRNDDLTHENDLLRETILNVVNVLGDEAKSLIPDKLLKHIEQDQVEHRKEDLRRLEATLNEKVAVLYKGKNFRAGEQGWKEERNVLFDHMHRVYTADPKLPLEPQLGFDPDSY